MRRRVKQQPRRAPTQAPDVACVRPTPTLDQYASFFHTFGACKIPNLFAAEIDGIIEGFDEVFRDHPAEPSDGAASLHKIAHPDHGTARLHIAPRAGGSDDADTRGFVERSAKLAWIPDDQRVTKLVEALLGIDYRYLSSVGNIFNSYISWHSDYFRQDIPPDCRIKLAFYLDRLDANSGALRIMPGTSHLGTYRSSLFEESAAAKPGRLEQLFGVPEDQLPCWPISVEPGDVIVFDNAVLHANFNGGPRRRMFVLQFAERAPGASAAIWSDT